MHEQTPYNSFLLNLYERVRGKIKKLNFKLGKSDELVQTLNCTLHCVLI